MTNIEKIKKALSYIPADDYKIYMQVVAALQWGDVYGELGGHGKELAREWASTSKKFDPAEFENKWRSYKRETDVIKVGTIFYLAAVYGYVPEKKNKNLSPLMFGDTFSLDLKQCRDIEDLQEQKRQIFAFLRLYKPEDFINIVLGSDFVGGKWRPAGQGITKTREEWERVINESVRNDSLIFSKIHKELGVEGEICSYNHAAGVWVRINPTDGAGIGNSNVSSYQYALVESDEMTKKEQKRLLKALNLPAVMFNDSGGKSLHAIVKIAAKNAAEYAERVRLLYDVCMENGLRVDYSGANASRLTRLPGIKRGANWQKIEWQPVSVQSFESWQTAMTMGIPQDMAADWDTFDPAKEIAPEIIQGVLRKGHKMLLGASSKAGKSMCLIELAMALATGGKWLGKQCMQSKVLYLNFEVDAASFKNRFHKVGAALKIKPPAGYLELWNLRGINLILSEFTGRVVNYCTTRDYDVIIIDPIYKLSAGDENKAGDIAKMCCAFDTLARALNASVIYSHHFAKGNAYSNSLKSVVDRVSGSGVFGRDADAVITMTQLHYSDNKGVTAWRVDSCLREFKPFEPFNVFFMYPLHVLDTLGELDDACYEGDTVIRGGEISGEMQAKKKNTRVEELKSYLHNALETAGGRCEMVDGVRAVRIQKVMSDLDIPRKTMYRYIDDLEDYVPGKRGYLICVKDVPKVVQTT